MACSVSPLSTSQDVITNQLPIVILSGFFILIGGYVLGIILQNQKMKLWARGEMWNFVANAIIIYALFGLMGAFSSSLTSSQSLYNFLHASLLNLPSDAFESGDCLYDVAYKYSLQLVAESLKSDAIISWAYTNFAYVSSISSYKCIFGRKGFILCMFGAPVTSYYPFLPLNWIGGQLASFSTKFLAYIYTMVFSQAILLRLGMSEAFLTLMAYTALLKILPFTRQFANVIFATLFGFIVFYPLLVIVEEPVLGKIDFTPGVDNTGISVNVTTASKLENLSIADKWDIVNIYAFGSEVTDIWQIKYDVPNPPCLAHNDVSVVCIPPLIFLYSKLLFKTLLFGSINFITVAVVIRGVLSLTNDTDNLMEMFIRMTGVVTW